MATLTIRNESAEVGSITVTEHPRYALPAAPIDSGDQTGAINDALRSGRSLVVPPGVWRVDGTIEIMSAEALVLRNGAQLVRTTDVTNTAPVVWIKGGQSSLLGEGAFSLVRSFNRSPEGVVKLGHRNMSESHDTVTYCTVSSVGIYGMQQYGQISGEPDVCLWMPNPQIGGKASYFHQLHNILFANSNIGLKLQGNANANTATQLQFIGLGGNDVGVENGAIYMDGAKENMISAFFVHFSPNARCIYMTQASGATVELNRVVNWVVEPGHGGTAQGLVVAACGAGNIVEGTINGVANDFGPIGAGFYGNNKRNQWHGINERQIPELHLRGNNPSLTMDATDVGGQKYSWTNSGQYLRLRNGLGVDLWEFYQSGTIYPTSDNAQDIGNDTHQVRRLYVGTEIVAAGKKVLGTRQPAIADSIGGDESAKINAVLAAMRAHGLIES